VGLPGGPARFLKTRYIVAVVVLAAIAVTSVTGFVWANKRVTVIVDGIATEYTTQSDTLAALLAEAGVRFDSDDLVSPTPKTEIADGATVVVRHAIPVTLSMAGERLELHVLGRTVADALLSAGLDPTSGLQSDPPVDALLEPDMEISATDVFIRVAEEEDEVPFDVIVNGDPSAPAGSRTVVTEGSIGKSLKVYQVLVVGGVEGPRFLKADKTLVAPVSQVVSLGTKRQFTQVLVSRGKGRATPPTPAIKGQTKSMRSTSYTPWDSTCSGHVSTILGKMRQWHIPAGWGLIAVDPRVIPLGSKVYVEGYGYAVAGDVGGAIKGDKIDICFWGADSNASYSFSDSDAEAVKTARRASRAQASRWMRVWGGKRVDVTILGR
jgi:uncharacterized protein YabE (DUF348 family)/3D (Asp-Asp-Asp) domain-containing protein